MTTSVTTTQGAASAPPLFAIGQIVRFRAARSLACHVMRRRRVGDAYEYQLASIDTRRDIGWQTERHLRAATQKRRVVR